MVDFAFYRDDYLGTKIPEGRFDALAKRAQAVLEKIKRCCRVEGGEQAQAMALCAMAECLMDSGKGAGIQSASVGGVSVRYADDRDSRLLGNLYRTAGVYLDIYRGV